MFRHVLFIGLAGLLAVGGAGCDPSGTDTTSEASELNETRAVTIHASNAPEHSILAWGLVGVRDVPNDAGLTIRVYELGGGDPATNGTTIMLGVSGGSDGPIFDLGMNIHTLESVEWAGRGLLVFKGTYDKIDEKGAVQNVPFAIDVRLEDTLGSVTVTRPESPQDRRFPEADATALFLRNVYKTTSREVGGVVARVHEIGGGDPVINGDRVFLSVMYELPSDGRTYDLDLDVAEVTAVDLRKSGDKHIVRIEGREDVSPGESRTFKREISFDVKWGVPSRTIGIAPVQ